MNTFLTNEYKLEEEYLHKFHECTFIDLKPYDQSHKDDEKIDWWIKKLHESHKRYAEWLVGLLEEQISQANMIQSPRLDDTIMGLDSAISIIKSSLN